MPMTRAPHFGQLPHRQLRRQRQKRQPFHPLWATNIHHAEIGCVTCHAEAGEIHPAAYQRQ